MYVLGMDVPLVEIFIGISALMLVTFLLIIYILIKLALLNRKINKITAEEDEELQQFKRIRKGVDETRKFEEGEVRALNRLKQEIEQILEAERGQLNVIKKRKK